MLTLRDQAFLAALSGGIGPDDFPGLHRWYKADYFNEADGVMVGVNGTNEWFDETGSGDDAGSVIGVTYRNIATFGGRQYLAFGPGHQLFAPGTLTDFTVIAVMRQTGTTSMLLQDSFGSGDQLRISFLGNDTRLFYDGTGVGQAANAWGSPAAVNAIAFRRSGTTVSFRENKTDRGSFVYSAANFDVVEIGSASLGGQLDLAEIMIWTSVLSDADVDLLYDDYLKPRWTALP